MTRQVLKAIVLPRPRRRPRSPGWRQGSFCQEVPTALTPFRAVSAHDRRWRSAYARRAKRFAGRRSAEADTRRAPGVKHRERMRGSWPSAEQ